MPMSLASAERIVLDVLGRQPPAAWPVGSIVSLAWQAFLDHRSWRWAAGSRATITLVVDQARYALPADLGQILVISGPSHWVQPVTLTTWRQLEEFRAAGYTALLGQPPFHAAVRWTAQDDGSFLPELELYPVPVSIEAGPLEVSYLPAAGPPPGNTDDLVLPYPPFVGPVWVEWLRCYALGLVEHDIAGIDERIGPVSQGPLMMAAIHRDAGASRIKSPMGGAACEYREWPKSARGFER